MWEKYKTLVIAVIVALAVGAVAGYMLGVRGNPDDDGGRSAAISAELRDEIANNQRLAAKNAELERINNQLGKALTTIESESAELRIELDASQRDAAAAAENNRGIEIGLQEAGSLTAADLDRLRKIRERQQTQTK